MGKAKQKQRECPAVGRRIGAVECGTHRASRYACPASCPFNPWAPDTYDAALAIEEALTVKLAHRLQSGPDAGSPWPDDIRPRSPEAEVLVLNRIFLGREAPAGTLFERWAADGFEDLSNDERVLLQAQAQMRPALLEVGEVQDDESCLVRDRLEPAAPPLVLHNRAIARLAVRFTRLLARI